MKHGCNLALCKAKQVKFGIFGPQRHVSTLREHRDSFKVILLAEACVKKFAIVAELTYSCRRVGSSPTWLSPRWLVTLRRTSSLQVIILCLCVADKREHCWQLLNDIISLLLSLCVRVCQHYVSDDFLIITFVCANAVLMRCLLSVHSHIHYR